ncbi:hypothetical protein [Archaeoglobus sp.]
MRVSGVIERFEELKKILRNWAIVRENEMEIIDPPFTITISKLERTITFKFEGRDVAVLTDDDCIVEKGFEGVVEEWLTALTSLGFKRYLLKS